MHLGGTFGSVSAGSHGGTIPDPIDERPNARVTRSGAIRDVAMVLKTEPYASMVVQ